jgi:hypothetical protein
MYICKNTSSCCYAEGLEMVLAGFVKTISAQSVGLIAGLPDGMFCNQKSQFG